MTQMRQRTKFHKSVAGSRIQSRVASVTLEAAVTITHSVVQPGKQGTVYIVDLDLDKMWSK